MKLIEIEFWGADQAGWLGGWPASLVSPPELYFNEFHCFWVMPFRSNVLCFSMFFMFCEMLLMFVYVLYAYSSKNIKTHKNVRALLKHNGIHWNRVLGVWPGWLAGRLATQPGQPPRIRFQWILCFWVMPIRFF